MERLYVGIGWLACSIEDDMFGVVLQDDIALFQAKAWYVGLFYGSRFGQGGAQREEKFVIVEGNLDPWRNGGSAGDELTGPLDPGCGKPCLRAMIAQASARLSQNLFKQGCTKLADAVEYPQQYRGRLGASLTIGILGGAPAQGFGLDVGLGDDACRAATGVGIQARGGTSAPHGAGGDSRPVDAA